MPSIKRRRRRTRNFTPEPRIPRHRLLVNPAIGDMMLLTNPALTAGARLTISVGQNQKENKKGIACIRDIFPCSPQSRRHKSQHCAGKNCCRSQWLGCKHLYTTINQSTSQTKKKTASLSQRQTRPSVSVLTLEFTNNPNECAAPLVPAAGIDKSLEVSATGTDAGGDR